MKKILVIEDDYSVRTGIVDLLEASSFQVFAAADGKEGIKLATEIIPDLVVCDIMMPGLSGYEVYSNLQTQKKTGFIPFIFLTAKADLKDIRLGLRLGVSDYIVKPYDAMDLLNSIEIRIRKSEELRAHFTTENKVQNLRRLEEEERIFIPSETKSIFLRIGDIVSIEADGIYSKVHCLDGSSLLLRKSLRKWQELLPEKIFLRIHRSAIINLKYIVRIDKWFNRSYKIFLKNLPATYIISRRYAALIKNILS